MVLNDLVHFNSLPESNYRTLLGSKFFSLYKYWRIKEDSLGWSVFSWIKYFSMYYTHGAQGSIWQKAEFVVCPVDQPVCCSAGAEPVALLTCRTVGPADCRGEGRWFSGSPTRWSCAEENSKYNKLSPGFWPRPWGGEGKDRLSVWRAAAGFCG